MSSPSDDILDEDGDHAPFAAKTTGMSSCVAMLSDVVTSAAMASRNLYTLLNDGDGSGTNVSCKTKDVDNDGVGYGYLLKYHFIIRYQQIVSLLSMNK
jgi:hypothetical protein